MSTAVIYARYSSDNQKETSIEDQLRLCNEYAERNGMQVVHEYCDKAKSGTSVKRRTQFNKMLADSESGRFDVVLVYATNRFARNTYDSFVYKHQLRENGVDIVSITEPMPDGDVGDLVEYLFSWEAAQYSKNLSKVVKRRLDQRALECKANGSRIYGYRKGPDGCYELDDAEAEVVRRIFSEWADGEQASEIVRRLNDDRIPNSNGREWSPKSIQHIIRNDRYLGIYKWGGVRVEGGMPAIVDGETFERCQRHSRRKSAHSRYLLTGKVYCACGRKMRSASGTSKSGRRYTYYRCPDCKSQIASGDLEDIVLSTTVMLLSEPETVGEIAEAVVAESKAEYDADVIEEEIAELDKKIARGVAWLLDGHSSKAMEAGIEELEAEKSRLEKRLAKAMENVVTAEGVAEWLMQYDCSDEEFNEAIVEHVAERITVDGSSVVIAYRTGEACMYDGSGDLTWSDGDAGGDCVLQGCSTTERLAGRSGTDKNTLPTKLPVKIVDGFVLVKAELPKSRSS